MVKKIKIAPSILSANFADMGNEVKRVTDAGADFIHIDVMDGVFVPNITFGIKMVKDIRKFSPVPFDCHLMIVNPEKYAARFAEAGADYITVHYETTLEKTAEILSLIKSLGVKCGLAINPDTPFEKVSEYLGLCDLFLVMSVFPGFGGQKFIGEVLEKCRAARRLADEKGYDLEIEIDGGINAETAPLAVKAGCDILVAGSALFGAQDKALTIKTLKNCDLTDDF